MAVEQTVVTGTYSLYLLTSLPTFTAYTICGWFKWVSAPNSYQAPFGLVTATSDYHTPYVTTADQIFRAQVAASSAFTDAVVRTLTTGAWYFFASRGNATSHIGSVIIAGESAVTSGSSVAGPPAGPPALLPLFGDAWAGQAWFGRGAHVKIYSATLSDTELLAEMAYAPVRSTNLVAYYPLATVATMQTDASGHGLTLGLDPGATFVDTADVPPVVSGGTTKAPPPFATFTRPRFYARRRR